MREFRHDNGVFVCFGTMSFRVTKVCFQVCLVMGLFYTRCQKGLDYDHPCKAFNIKKIF
jgi:hypothetical protein